MVLLTYKNRIRTQRVHEGVIINLRVDTLEFPNGNTATREVVEHNGGVAIACQPEPDKVILIRQYRYPIDEELLELPAGRIEIGEDPLVCAKRELTEETGYKAQSWKELVQMYSAPGFCNELLYVYLASNVSFQGKNLDADEETEVEILSVNEAWKLALAGKIRDAKTIAGIGLLTSL